LEDKTLTRPTIDFGKMTRDEQQAFAEFQLKELLRHLEDVSNIIQDLNKMEKQGIRPTGKFLDKWIEI
jgi:hypothetical protein